MPLSSSTGARPVTPLSIVLDLTYAQVSLSGELDRESAHHVLDALSLLVRRSARRWRLDASGVTFCDAGGLRALGRAHRLALRHGRELELVGSRPIDRLVDLVGHDMVFPAPPPAGGRRTTAAVVGVPPRRRTTPDGARRIRWCTTGTL